MSNRPSLAKKHTTKTDANSADLLNQGYRLHIDGEVYQATLGDVTPPIARELRKATGMGFLALIRAMSEDSDIDLISAAVWVARRCAGEMVSVDDVEVQYASLLADEFDVEVAQSPEEKQAPDPEA